MIKNFRKSKILSSHPGYEERLTGGDITLGFIYEVNKQQILFVTD